MQDGYDIFTKGDSIHVRVWARGEKELFAHALLGIASIMRPDITLHNKHTIRIRLHVHGKDVSDTLERFLAAVIFESDMHTAVFSAADFIVVSGKEVECELIGKAMEHKEEELIRVFLEKPGVQVSQERLDTELVCDTV